MNHLLDWDPFNYLYRLSWCGHAIVVVICRHAVTLIFLSESLIIQCTETEGKLPPSKSSFSDPDSKTTEVYYNSYEI